MIAGRGRCFSAGADLDSFGGGDEESLRDAADRGRRMADAIEQIQAIVNSLQANPRIESAEVIKMPVDLRPESKFSTESGVEIKQANKKKISGMFTLKITMKAPDHV